MYLQIAALLLLTAMTPAQSDDQDIKPRTFGPLLGSIGGALLGGLAGHLTQEEFGPLAPYYGPSYGSYLPVNRPHHGHIGPYGLNGYGYPGLTYPFFPNAETQLLG
jgi:hypothetical protein